MTEADLYNRVAYGPIMPKRCITLHRPTGEGCLYLLSGEILAIERIISTVNYTRVEQCKLFVAGNSFLVKETADEVLDWLGWQAE